MTRPKTMKERLRPMLKPGSTAQTVSGLFVTFGPWIRCWIRGKKRKAVSARVSWMSLCYTERHKAWSRVGTAGHDSTIPWIRARDFDIKAKPRTVSGFSAVRQTPAAGSAS